MATAVRVEAAVAGRRRAGTAEHALDLDLAAHPVPLRTLIEAVVRAEVAAFRQRAEDQRFVRVLTERSLAEGVERGVVRSGGLLDDTEAATATAAAAGDVDADQAVAAALLAHQDGLYQVIVDDEPVGDLDAPVDLRADSRLLFLRLVALAGG
ncbi:MAG: hypothetical protein QOG82_1382 [Actinomycetota bacterium]|jgi:hypothetical protein|nr:hypothetical protein [Actinomycetota bacterium]